MSCLNDVFVYGFIKVHIRSTQCFYFVGVLLFCDNMQTHLGALLLGRALLIGTLHLPGANVLTGFTGNYFSCVVPDTASN